MNKPVPLYLAPMAGITDAVYRRICFENGCDAATTEMISAQGYMTAPDASRAYSSLLAILPGEGPVRVQLFGREPYWFSEASKKLTSLGTFTGIDINIGCPAHKVTGGGNGSALMKSLPLAGQIIAACVRSTPLPVSVKMRLGWDEDSVCAAELAHIAQEEGAAEVTVHGRVRTQFYAGHADWPAIAEVKNSVRIPVIANGDITSASSAREALETTGCDGLAIGRAALGNPWIFSEIKSGLSGNPYQPPPFDRIIATAFRQAEEMTQEKGEHRAVLEMRKFFSWYISGKRGAARLRTRINQASSLAEIASLIKETLPESR